MNSYSSSDRSFVPLPRQVQRRSSPPCSGLLSESNDYESVFRSELFRLRTYPTTRNSAHRIYFHFAPRRSCFPNPSVLSFFFCFPRTQNSPLSFAISLFFYYCDTAPDCDFSIRTSRRISVMNRYNDEGASSSSTSRSSQQTDTDDDRMIAIVLSEEYANLDNAVAKRLSNLSSIPHVPRINTCIPNYSDASFDHERLFQRLNAYGLQEVKVSGDGNCQFRALSDQLFRSPEYHKNVRKEVVRQLKEYRSLYEGYVPMKYKKYCKKMAKSGEWGDHVTLQAAADKFIAKICLLTSFRDTCFVEIIPQSQAPQRELWLSFWSEVHYNSLYDAQELAVRYKPRKKHWLF